MRPTSALAVICGLFAMLNFAYAQRAPAFQDCAAEVQSIHKAPSLAFTDSGARKYRSILRDAVKGPVNFAGHYVLAEWGCGSGCVMAAAIDKKSGRVTSLPFTVSDWPLEITEPLEYRVNSCLLIVRGSRNEGSEHGTYYYIFDGTGFSLHATASTPSH